jgi:hypothetical protein
MTNNPAQGTAGTVPVNSYNATGPEATFHNVRSATATAYNPAPEVLNNHSLRLAIAEFLPEREPPKPRNLVRRSPRLAPGGPVICYQICVRRTTVRNTVWSIPIYESSPPPPRRYRTVRHSGHTFRVPDFVPTPAELQSIRRHNHIVRQQRAAARRQHNQIVRQHRALRGDREEE